MMLGKDSSTTGHGSDVTFSVPTAGAAGAAHSPNEADTSDAPLYAVVMHEGREVLYKRVEA